VDEFKGLMNSLMVLANIKNERGEMFLNVCGQIKQAERWFAGIKTARLAQIVVVERRIDKNDFV